MLTAARTSALALATVAVLTLTACNAPTQNVRDESGAITEANDDADVFDLRVGDCLDESGDEEVQSVPTVPCADEHDYEVYSSTDVEGDDYPGQDAVNAQADEYCVMAFDAFVGTAYDESALDYSTFTPTQESWDYNDDREILCLVYHPEEKLTGTAKDSRS